MKYWIIGLVVVLLLTNAFWLFVALNYAVTNSYQADSRDYYQSNYLQALQLANKNLIGQSVDSAKKIIGKDLQGYDLIEKEGCLYVDQICLQIGKNKKIEVIREAYP